MHRGYYKSWRKMLESDLWDKSPLHLKVWTWILASVDYQTGELTCTMDHIADRVQWSDKGHPHIPSRKVIHDILHWMKLNSMLSITTLGEGNRKYTKLSVCQWSTYQSKESGDGNRTETEKLPSLRSTKHLKETTFVASHEAERCLKAWEQYRPIIEKHRQTYLKVFDDLHTLDKLPWEGEDGIFSICGYAVKEWTAGMIQAPSKMRRPSKQYPELKNWQVIQGQLLNHMKGRGANGNGTTELTDDLKAAIAKRMPDVHA